MTVLSVVPANRLNMNEIRSEIGSPATNLFDFKWSDHILNDIQWLRADTFSWQSGDLYVAAYNHLLSDLNSSSTTITTTYYAWDGGFDIYYTLSETPQVDDYVYTYENDSFVEHGQISSVSTDTIGIDSDHNFCTRDSSSDKTVSSDSGVHTETIGSYTITYYLAEDGHKIVLPDMEEAVANIYNELGVAWYYILDTDNQRFKLPRTKWGFTGIRDSVGNYIAESLPNYEAVFVNHWRDYSAGKSITPVSGAIAVDSNTYPKTSYPDIQPLSSGSYQYDQTLKISPSLSNSTYQDNAPVQERATQMYLYFYVGNYAQSAVEQTAGLNSELFNNKVDLPAQKNQSDIDFVIESQLPTAENNYTWYRLYKSGWVEQGGYIATGSSSNTTTPVTLLKPMKDNTYSVQKTYRQGAANSSGFGWDWMSDVGSGAVNTSTTVYLSIPGSGFCLGISWEVKGKGA